MHIQVNAFKDLIKQYPSWVELQKYLESPEGGLFRVVDNTEDGGVCLIRYEKGTSKMDLPHSKWFRSVVWNTKTNRPMCVAPPKATNTEFPFKALKDISDANINCQELLDGFMINCFRFGDDKTLHITSRSKLNAAGKFYSNKSFRELFEEAYVNTNNGSDDSAQNKYQDIRSPNSSEVATFYSFLVQHMEHRNVKPIISNRVYLVHSGVVYDDGRIEIEDSPEMVRGVPNIENIPLVPAVIKSSYAQIVLTDSTADAIDEVQKWIKQQLIDRDWSFQGLVFKDSMGNRWRYRSEKYSAVKTLRGNSPNIIERFAQLYTQSLIVRYLEYYPEDKQLIVDHMKFMDIIIKLLYDNYVDLHITKVRTADTVDKMYLPHLYSIHGIYLNQLKPNGKKVNFYEIKEYLHKQPWQRIVFLIKKLPKA
ncbi:MAG: hypothetical protein WCL22_06175 [bacterium]